MQAPKQRTHRSDWMSAALIILFAITASGRLAATEWTEFLYFAQTLAILGAILGLALGYSLFKRQAVVWLTLGYSIVLIPGQLSMAIDQDVLLAERLASVGGRLLFSLEQFFRREPVEDGLLFVTFISILIWFLCVLSGYWWTRHGNYLAAMLPNGIFTLTIQLYDKLASDRIWILGAYILFSLLLLGRSYFLKNREDWRTRRVFQMQESAFDLTRGMVITAVLFVFVAWTVPASRAGLDSAVRTWNRFTKPWRELQDWFSNAVDPLDAPTTPRSGDFYGNFLNLGTGNPLSEAVVLSIEAPELYEQQARFYWRGYVYDRYQNNGWGNSDTDIDEFIPSDDQLVIPDAGRRSLVRFTITTRISQSLLYVPTQPLWVSRPGEIKVTITEEGEQDLFAWRAEPRLSPGEQYQVRATVADPSIQELQSAGTQYPQWVTDKYLQLPEDFSPLIRDLAVEITQGQETPYDKAAAITSYLRSEITYVNPLPEAPPEGEDPLEWVLFDLRQGFCNYYATAEVLMLRSLGIPARMAVGFSEGGFDPESLVYIVRSLDAHAWPEVFFPGIGWIEFEPTSNQAPLVRPDRPVEETAPGVIVPGLEPETSDTPDQESQPEEGQTGEDNTTSTLTEQNALIPLLYIGSVALIIGLVWLMNRQYAVIDQLPSRLQAVYERSGGQSPAWISNWARWNALSPIERSFETINRSLRLLGKKPAIFLTPTERASALEQILPQATSAIETLTEQHQASLFTTQPGNPSEAKRASLRIWLYTIQVIIQKLIEGSDE